MDELGSTDKKIKLTPTSEMISPRTVSQVDNRSANKATRTNTLQEVIQYVALHRIRRLEDDHIEQVTTKLVEGQATEEAAEYASGMTLNYHKIKLATTSENVSLRVISHADDEPQRKGKD